MKSAKQSFLALGVLLFSVSGGANALANNDNADGQSSQLSDSQRSKKAKAESKKVILHVFGMT